VGIVDEVGAGIPHWKKGQRIGVGWHSRHELREKERSLIAVSSCWPTILAKFSAH
jgi:hypothetical protein